MTLTQLRTFVAVAGTGSVREAAEHLFVSQPAVSAALASLQAELGVAPVQREGRGLVITPAGHVFARYARRVLGLLDEAAAAFTGEVAAERGLVRLDAVTTAGEHALPRFLASFRSQYKDAEVSLEVGNRVRVWTCSTTTRSTWPSAGAPTPARSRTLATLANTLVVVATPAGPRRAPGDPAVARPVSVPELGRQTRLLREPGSGTRSTTEEMFEELGIFPSTLTLGANGAIRESVQVGLGVTLISHDAVARELEQGDLEEWAIPGEPRDRSWHLVGRADEELPGSARLFLAHLTAGDRPSPERFRLVGDAAAAAGP